LPKHRRQNNRNSCRSRNKRHRVPASSSCLHPVGPVARRDGGGGDQARELHASNFSEIERRTIAIAAGTSQFLQRSLSQLRPLMRQERQY
jgi:hypothetical protein